ncbi:MAG: hypothetical protein OEW30_22020 [Acidimicrobiia bacterium]|nr:hypothetical protein [Acidimicrobiia bacterium]
MSGPIFEIAGRRYRATMSTGEAAELFGCSPERLQSERGQGTLPVEPLQLGRRLRWPTVLVAAALGLEAVQLVEREAARAPVNGRRAQGRCGTGGRSGLLGGSPITS